jgi:prepilin-type N-terminal cleavage/methylation domain-containing protein
MSNKRRFSSRRAFTLIELLVVIAIIAVLAVVVVLTLNPSSLLQQSRDTTRISDMNNLSEQLNLYNTDQGGSPTYFLGNANTVYVSLPDLTATSSAGTNCSSLGLLSLPNGYIYHCAGPTYYQNVNGQGWIPVNFDSITSGSSLSQLPVDPTNSSSSNLYYTYSANGTQYELTAVMESKKYGPGGSNDVVTNDGGSLAKTYTKGNNLALEPLDYGAGPPSASVSVTCYEGSPANSLTMGPISTAGANAIAVAVASFNGITSVTHSVGSDGNATALTAAAGNSPSNQFFYWQNPSTGGSDTFTVTSTGALYGTACVYIMSGISGIYSSAQNENPTGGTTCQPGSITPSGSNQVVITAFGVYTPTGAPTINSSYSTPVYNSGAGGTAYAEAGSYLIQTTGASTNPTWTWTNGASTPACIIAAFH